MSNTKNDLAWSGACQDCLAIHVVYPHPETEEETVNMISNGPSDWDGFTDCFVCGGSIDWNGSDPVSAVIR